MYRLLLGAFFAAICAVSSTAQTANEVTAYKRALALMSRGEWSQAKTIAGTDVAADIIEWHRLRRGNGSFDEVLAFLDKNADWPGLALMRRKAEVGLPIASREDDVMAFFDGGEPQGGAGYVALVSALRSLGREAEAQELVLRAWTEEPLSAADEDWFLTRYADLLKAVHEDRLDMLLWRADRAAVERMLPRVSESWRALARARLALRSEEAGVDVLIEKVPEALQDDPGLAFERMQWRARKGRNAEAIDLMLERGADELGRPGYWAGWRRSFARVEMRAGRTERAYRLASAHGLDQGSSFADLEWLSGYLALTYRKKPEDALQHFLRFRGAVQTPISLGRAGYWEGRAHEAIGDPEAARLAYSFGAEYQTSFYGLLAAEKAGIGMQPAFYEAVDFPNWDVLPFGQSSVFHAARLMISAGERNLAEQFLTHLTESLSPDEIGSLGDYVLSRGEPHLAVMIGKQAARAGIVVPSAYYPRVDLRVPVMPVPEELALAIARRESEFDPVVRSGVGARGLMQLMPGTAADVSRYLGISYEVNRLTSDPAYNARLGTTYLDELMAMFDGNIVMTAAGYNAGPGRPMRWMDALGDPRNGRVDIIDWIEHIPFDETRNYVMRVAESLPVYRARLTGEAQPMALSQELIARPGHARQAVRGTLHRPVRRPEILTD